MRISAFEARASRPAPARLCPIARAALDSAAAFMMTAGCASLPRRDRTCTVAFDPAACRCILDQPAAGERLGSRPSEQADTWNGIVQVERMCRLSDLPAGEG